MERNILLNCLLVVVLTILAGNVKGQEINEVNTEKNRILLNEVRKNDKITLREPVLYISAKSLREEDLTCSISKGNQLIKETTITLEYGMNEAEISLQELVKDLQKGEVFQFHFQAKYFGKGNFDLYMELPPVMANPIASIQVNPLEVNCEVDLVSSIELFGSAQGGTAPYKLTWLVSKGPFVKDLINPPLEMKLTNDQEVSRMMIAETLDYYVTLLVEDACGNNDKKVMHIKCGENDNDGMIYFQPIEFNKTTKSPGL